MATSEVKRTNDRIADSIATNKERLAAVVLELQAIESDYGLYPTRYGDHIAEVGGYVGTPPLYQDATPFEGAAKDELARLTAQYLASLARTQAMIAAAE